MHEPWTRLLAPVVGEPVAGRLRAADADIVDAGAGRSPRPAGVEVVWLGQAAFKITTPGGKIIVTDPWLRTSPLTPAAYRQLEHFGRIDVLRVSHGHFDHIADAPALAQMYNVPIRAPRDLASTAMTLGVLPAALLPRRRRR